MGWGDVIGKIFDWIPNRREHYRNKIEDIKNEMDRLQKEGLTGKRADKFIALAKLLRNLREKAKNT